MAVTVDDLLRAFFPNGPLARFPALARDPAHWEVGTGFNDPTTFEAIKEQAVAAGVDMADYTEEDWLDVGGKVTILDAFGLTYFDMEMTGMVPGGFYTAWLVRKPGSPRGGPADLNLGRGWEGEPGQEKGYNGIVADEHGNAKLGVLLTSSFQDANGQEYQGLDKWDEIHIAFHSDNIGHGFSPGPNHWTQTVFRVRDEEKEDNGDDGNNGDD
ncbi:unnamed protein product [Vitrella brassicaformis CCMP3155]|uniref:Uncharacterized protein n=2 Tax=Vitrella brassicaformis TaxID=1169539 RepID=A0A0G4EDN2_VITBC|nr:unnamed protein product [Vitrella brassicaformis CCMP3155]|eukprot:CEL93635.1 unnamed protein product [Vitrella brassicaformis CCMP3155]